MIYTKYTTLHPTCVNYKNVTRQQ